MQAIVKPQYVDNIPRAVKGTVMKIINRKNQMTEEKKVEIMKKLDLMSVADESIATLSGGQLQRFAIAVVCIQKAQMYVF